ncbi:hemolysin family protein [Rhodocaloribacter litoris]|uniref:hemolysin family protein n=1 Tax=Rhodocaloribacter litoris TaxID=2558931 RepID=UPI0014209868|nr:hemolysin family protein [Rhodocaloribacter litoris]QXD16958.1 hemolysin family protein [Rhodocaloribacter litoris]
MELLLILLMLVLSAFFSGSEIAFVTANRLRVEVSARRGGRLGTLVQTFIQNPADLLTTTLVGNNLALVIYSTLMAFYLEPPLHRLYAEMAGFSEATTEVAVLATQTVIASMIVLFFGEILPKTVLREVANRAVFVLAVPLRLTYVLLLPLIKVAGWAAAGLIRLFGTDADTFSQFMRRDFELMIEESKKSGELDLDEEESTLLANVFALSTIRVKESMVPRTEIVAVEENTTLEALRQKFIESGHSKLPVYRENIDNIVGIAFAYDLFHDPESLAAMMRPAYFVPETKLSKDLLREFLATNTSIAIVIDEYGGTAGLVTIEDLLEELFGDIQDEFDTDEEVLRQLGEDTYLVSGRVDIDELAERFGIELSEGDYETLAGYLLEHIGAIPKPNEEYEFDGYRFTIVQATANRIDLVRITRLPAGA